jgi:hypothetical protein
LQLQSLDLGQQFGIRFAGMRIARRGASGVRIGFSPRSPASMRGVDWRR